MTPASSLNLPHRVRLPDSASPGPAVVMVHGWLGNEDVMWIFEQTLPLNVIAVSPRAPFPGAEDGQSGYGWFVKDDEESFGQGLAALHEFVTQLPAVYPVDPARVILLGFSQGAAMCYALKLAQPTVAAATAALAGFLPRAAGGWIAPRRLIGKPVFIAHGVEDESVPVAEARRAREALTACGADVEYHEYSIGHKISARGMRDLRAWLARVSSENHLLSYTG